MSQYPTQYGQQGYQQGPPQGYNQYAPPQQHGAGASQHQGSQQDSGAFAGGSYNITHRNTNTILSIDLQQGASVRSQPGAMIHMSGTVQLTGKVNFGWKKLFTGSEIAESTYVGPGRVALAPQLFGDIMSLPINGRDDWSVTKHAYLACTADVVRDTKSQGFGRGIFSEEGIFVYKFGGQGLIWLTSFGAVDRLDLQPGEQHIIDNGHLVAWSCQYEIERAGGGTFQSMKTGEGLVCRFVGPGTVYLQSRNRIEFDNYIREIAETTRR